MSNGSSPYQDQMMHNGSPLDGGDVMYLEPPTDVLPENVKEQLRDLETQLKEGDLTDKGFQKRRSMILIPYLIPYSQPRDPNAKTDTSIEPEIELLPASVVEELNKLQEELQNEEITEKGLNKKRAAILAPYMLKEPPRCELPANIQQEYYNLELEFKEGDITEKGFKKRKLQLLKPYLVAVNPTIYTDPQNTVAPSKDIDSINNPKVVMCIQSVMNDGKKLFKCGVCGEVFNTAHSFSGHCRLHRRERVKKFRCNICDASYTTRSHLKFHMFKHTGDFPYNCRHCGKGFAGRSQHKSHESRHTGDSPYPCPQCGAKFWKKDKHELHVKNSCPHTVSSTSGSPIHEEKHPWSPHSVSSTSGSPIHEEKHPWTPSADDKNLMNSDHLTSDHLTSDHMTSDHMTSDHMSSDHMTSDHLNSADLKVEWTPVVSDPYNVDMTSESHHQTLSQGFHTGDDMPHGLHGINIQDFNISTIPDLSDMTSSICTDVYTRDLTTPTLPVVSTLGYSHSQVNPSFSIRRM